MTVRHLLAESHSTRQGEDTSARTGQGNKLPGEGTAYSGFTLPPWYVTCLWAGRPGQALARGGRHRKGSLFALPLLLSFPSLWPRPLAQTGWQNGLVYG